MDFEDVLSFWFDDKTKPKWWIKDVDFDQQIKDAFLSVHEQATRCELFDWRDSPRGRLAEIIVLDQFSRNMFRDTPAAFSADSLALALAQEAVSKEAHLQLSPEEQAFLYMPYMHSESLKIHDVAIALFKDNKIQSNLDFEIAHRKIIERFGRYPHRNKILNRKSTDEEIAFLAQPGSPF